MHVTSSTVKELAEKAVNTVTLQSYLLTNKPEKPAFMSLRQYAHNGYAVLP